MKHLRHFVFVVFMLLTSSAWAYDFEVDGIYYIITNSSVPYQVSVTSKGIQGSYTGDVIIPQSVHFGEKTYSVTAIEYSSFENCTELTSINIPNSVIEIGDHAFSGCNSLASITIPISVKVIYHHAFSKCTGLVSISIPKSVIEIGNGTFAGCTNLNSITVASDNPAYDSRNNCNAIIQKGSNKLICGCKTTVIPNTVTIIGKRAFEGCIGLISINIPNSVTSIEQEAFEGCSGLVSLNIPNSLTNIAGIISGSGGNTWNAVFRGCSSLSSISVDSGNPVFDSRNNCNAIIHTETNTMFCGCNATVVPPTVTTIASSTFYNCTGLSSIIIPNSVQEIGACAFYNCTGLTSITIPNSVTNIGSGVFEGCTGLTSITIPNSVTNIAGHAFCYCSSLQQITIPNSVTSIGDAAFCGCASMASISIPNSVTIIGADAFAGCYRLTTVNCFATVPPILGNHAFGDDVSNKNLFVPCGRKEAYSIANNWNLFSNIYIIETEVFPYVIEARANDENLGRALVTQQPDCENPCIVLAQPINGSLFLYWRVNGLMVSPANPYTFDVEENIEIVAVFSGTGVEEETQQHVSILPNPVKDWVRIECEMMRQVDICTMDGRRIATFQNLNEACEVDLSSLASGFYITRIRMDNGIVVNKKIKKE